MSGATSTYRGPAYCSDCGSEERLTITCERCLTLFEEYGQQCKAIAETCQALANIGTGVLIAHLCSVLGETSTRLTDAEWVTCDDRRKHQIKAMRDLERSLLRIYDAAMVTP